MIRLGIAKLMISPDIPLRLCGYASRTENFTCVTEDIFLRVHYWRTDTCRVVIVYADLLWWNPDFIDVARPMLERKLGITEDEVLFTASHNHSGPGTGCAFTPLLETASESYVEFLLQKVLDGIAEAERDLEEVSIRRFNGECAMNVYRRKKTEEGIQMLPNYEVPSDTNLTIFEFAKKSSGKPKGFAVHYACHNNLSAGNSVHPDYAGVVLRRFDEAYPKSVSIFLQGCTADLRPNSVLGNRFTSIDFEKVMVFADDFFKVCKDILKKQSSPVKEYLKLRKTRIKLPLVQDFSKDEVASLALKAEDESGREWAKKAIEKNFRDYETLEITRVDFGSSPVYFFNAEMSQQYASAVRQRDKNGLCVCYTNGMIGYLCTEKQIAEGGYEPQGSALYFALCGTYSLKTENLINKALDNFNN
ncbi:alkaline ceramidase [Treponema parvum]|uniref:Alkaline ceramidase n=1 Tax=Treponema parvum TaxID=138851 RepID=A0A975EZI3_9SPIR|nr:hypothetical protein [Treponema parvum]QTQ11648.1 alkaline ceramidase [Treponema parvum]